MRTGRPKATLKLNEDEKRELTSLAHRQPDAGGCLIYQRLAPAAIFSRPRQNFQEIVRCFPITTCFPIRSFPCCQVRSESKTQFTLAERLAVKSALATIRQTQVASPLFETT